jgi:hypothetical protein
VIIFPEGDQPAEMSHFEPNDDRLRGLVPLHPWMVCPVTGEAHEYARQRDARSHRLCTHCQQMEPAGEPEHDDGGDARGSEPPAHDEKGGAA